MSAIEFDNSECGYIKGQTILLYLCIALFDAVCYAVFPNIVLQIFIAGTLLFSFTRNPFVLLNIFIIHSIYINGVFSGAISSVIILIIGISFFVSNTGMLRHFRGGVLLLLSCAIIVPCSFIVGINPSLTTALLLIIGVTFSLAIINNTDKVDDEKRGSLVWALICRAISITVYFLIQYSRGVTLLQYGRLAFNDNIKAAAEVVAIPLLILLCVHVSGKRLFSNINPGLWKFLMEVSFGIVLILTAAKGMIFAIIVGLLIFIAGSKSKEKIIVRLIPVCILIAAFIFTQYSNSTYRIARLFADDDAGGFNGRFTIWAYYYDFIVQQGPMNIAFGLGPGDLARVGSINRYAHSTFLDYFFSYGLAGFATCILAQLLVLKRIIKTKNMLYISLLIACMVMYSTHGVAANTSFFILETVIFLCAESSRKVYGFNEELTNTGNKAISS